MGCLAIAAPFFVGPSALFLVGLLLIVCGVFELLEIFQVSEESFLRSAYLSGGLSISAGMLLLAHPEAVLRGVAYLLAGLFFVDGLGKTVAAWRARTAHGPWRRILVSGLVNILLAVALITRWPFSGSGVALILVGFRMLTAGWSMLVGWKVGSDSPTPIAAQGSHPDCALGLPAHAEFARLDESMANEETARRRIDAGWCWTFVLIFFAIHIGRMNVTYDLVGMISPFVAVLGDVATSLLIAFGLILPYRVFWRRMTRPIERRCWHGFLARLDQDQGPGLRGRLYGRWLVGRFRFARQAARMKFSLRAAVRWGLFVGLPATAILIAVNPIWGFSWFFNSESWTTGVWDRWAAARTDVWREQMVRAVEELPQAKSLPPERLFQVAPEGVEGKSDFSFLVLGDTGEGGTAQQSLRDQYLTLGQRPDVKFLVISSDVIYPSGAMADYESKFYLPFKGFTKPIYAIPGNHDWYDALEGFAANFFEAEAARACMRARVEADQRIATTTDSRIEALIREAGRLRREFGVSTGWQCGPFFELQTDRFALIAVDTGVLRQVDTEQWRWLKKALERSRGKFILANLGHPLYAGGR